MNELYRVKKQDLPRCSAVLARAFYDYPMYRHVLGGKHTLENMKTATRFFVTYAYHYGEVYAPSQDIQGVLCTVDYRNHRMTLFRLLHCCGWQLAALGGQVRRRYDAYDRFSTQVHRDIIAEPRQYIMCIGIAPERQGRGLASYMLRPALEAAASKGCVSYLETHEQRNVDIYGRYGFELISEHHLPDSDITLYAMLTKP